MVELIAKGGRRQAGFNTPARGGQRTGARGIHEVAEREHDQDRNAEHHQRLDAAAGKDAVEDLQHVKRRRQQRQIEQQAGASGQRDERAELLGEQPAHRNSSRVRFFHLVSTRI